MCTRTTDSLGQGRTQLWSLMCEHCNTSTCESRHQVTPSDVIGNTSCFKREEWRIGQNYIFVWPEQDHVYTSAKCRALSGFIPRPRQSLEVSSHFSKKWHSRTWWLKCCPEAEQGGSCFLAWSQKAPARELWGNKASNQSKRVWTIENGFHNLVHHINGCKPIVGAIFPVLTSCFISLCASTRNHADGIYVYVRWSPERTLLSPCTKLVPNTSDFHPKNPANFGQKVHDVVHMLFGLTIFLSFRKCSFGAAIVFFPRETSKKIPHPDSVGSDFFLSAFAMEQQEPVARKSSIQRTELKNSKTCFFSDYSAENKLWQKLKDNATKEWRQRHFLCCWPVLN